MGQQYPNSADESQLVTLDRVLQTLREESSSDVLIETTIEYLHTEFNYRLIWIGLYDRIDHRLFGKGGITPQGELSFLRQRFNLNPGDTLEQVVIQQKPLGIPNLQEESRMGEWQKLAVEFGVQGTLLFPIRCKDRCYGLALLGSHLWGISPRQGERAIFSLVFGTLGAALYQIESDWQRSATKRADQPLFQLLEQLLHMPTLATRLESIVNMTQDFIRPTRTNIYWYSPEKRYFWHRVGNRIMARGLETPQVSAAGITAAEATDFYQILSEQKVVAIGANRSPLKADSTGRLLSRLKSRSILAAPILIKSDLMGFLSVEDNQPRIWEESERNYIRAIAQLVSLVSINEDLEETLYQSQQDTLFSQAIAQITITSPDTNTALKEITALLHKRLECDHIILLEEDSSKQWQVVYQYTGLERRPLTVSLEALTQDDRDLLNQGICYIEDFQQSKRFISWQPIYNQLSIRSLLMAPIKSNDSAGLFLLMVCMGNPRTWNNTEKNLVSLVAGQIQMLIAFFSAKQQVLISSLVAQSVQAGLRNLEDAPKHPQQFEQSWLSYLGQTLACPLVSLWQPDTNNLNIYKISDYAAQTGFDLPRNLTLPASDPVIQAALKQPGEFLYYSLGATPTAMRKIFSGSGVGQVLVISLPADPQTKKPEAGQLLFLLGDIEGDAFSAHLRLQGIEKPAIVMLLRHFVLMRHYRLLQIANAQEKSDLQLLNWYKHCCLEILHQSVTERIFSMSENSPSPEGSQLQQTRTAQILHQLEGMLATLSPVLAEELWDMKNQPTAVPLVGIVKRSLRNLELLCRQRKVFPYLRNNLAGSVYGDRWKLECVIFEVLLTCILRSQPGSRLSILSRDQPKEGEGTLLELIITERRANGEALNDFKDISGQLLFNPNSEGNNLVNLVVPPLVNWKICQQMLRGWGGELSFSTQGDGSIATRLVLISL